MSHHRIGQGGDSRSFRLDATLRILATLVGTLPGAILAGVCLARFLPLGEAARFTIGFTLTIPLWVAGMCCVFLTRSPARAWGWCLGAALVLGVLAYQVPP